MMINVQFENTNSKLIVLFMAMFILLCFVTTIKILSNLCFTYNAISESIRVEGVRGRERETEKILVMVVKENDLIKLNIINDMILTSMRGKIHVAEPK